MSLINNLVNNLIQSELINNLKKIGYRINHVEFNIGGIVYNGLYISSNDNYYFIFRKVGEFKFTFKKLTDKDKVVILKSNTGINKLNFIRNLMFVKIKDYKLSSDIFGYRLRKKSMFDSKFQSLKGNSTHKYWDIENVLEDVVCNKDKVTRDIVVLKDIASGKSLKFVIDDVEIVFPNIPEIIKANKLKETLKTYDNFIISNIGKKINVNKKLNTLNEQFKIKNLTMVNGKNNKKLIIAESESGKQLALNHKQFKIIK